MYTWEVLKQIGYLVLIPSFVVFLMGIVFYQGVHLVLGLIVGFLGGSSIAFSILLGCRYEEYAPDKDPIYRDCLYYHKEPHNSHSFYLKCAVNPTEPCAKCDFYEPIDPRKNHTAKL